MSQRLGDHGLRSVPASAVGSPIRVAYAVWAVTFALGVLFHLFQFGEAPWTFHLVPAVFAIGVLLRPTSVPRMVAVLAALAVELILYLPEPSNHLVIVGLAGAAVTLWWSVTAWRSPAAACDPAYVAVRVAPFLRLVFIIAFFAAGVAKVNTGFLDAVQSCAVWIVESIPLMTVPAAVAPALVVVTVAIELAIPTLLVFRRTRGVAVVLGLVFHLISALAGHTAFSGLAWSFYLLFLPPGVLARAAALVRGPWTVASRAWIARVAARPLAWCVLVAAWAFATGLLQVLPAGLVPDLRRWGAALPYVLSVGVWVVVLYRLRRHWLIPPSRSTGGGLRVRSGLFLAVLVLLVVDAASPYLGLKTRYSFTMYSDLRTEPGLWNHLIVPEAVRVFDLQDGAVRLVAISDPELADRVAARGGDRLVLLDARRLVAQYPAATVTYELDGRRRVAAPVGTDPVLGVPVPPLVQVFGGFRPIDGGESCQH